MNYQNRMKHWLVLLLCVLMAAGVMAQGAMAVPRTAEPTGACTHAEKEGIEYYVPLSVLAEDANDWRRDLNVTVDVGGTVIAMEMQVANSGRYQCTEIAVEDPAAIFSCNSVPVNGVITGVYLYYNPDGSVTEDDTVLFKIAEVTNAKTLMTAKGKVKFPPYPCSRNDGKKDLVADDGKALVYNTSDNCDTNKDVIAYEKPAEFAIVNIIPGDKIVGDRININVEPKVTYSYDMNFYFVDSDESEYKVTFTYHEVNPSGPEIDASSIDGLELADLPLWLDRVEITNIDTTKTDLWGNKDYPTQTDFDIKFWYENTAGTLGYQNSIFHFERNMTVQFAPYCTDPSSGVMTGIATALYDPCQAKKQLFTVDLRGCTSGSSESGGGDAGEGDDESGECTLQGILVPHDQTECDSMDYCEDVYSVNPPIYDYAIDHKTPKLSNYRFITRKCVDAACASYKTTSAYPYSLTVSDAKSQSTTYKHHSNSSGSNTVFQMRLYEDTDLNRPFAITGTRFMAEEPGTYVVFGFMQNTDIKAKDLRHYAVKFYVTVNQKDELTTCSTLANNGYFRAYWDDCQDYRVTQLMPFEHIPGTEEAWINNRSGKGIHFPYVSEWSYLPQKLEVASLNCKFEAIASGGQPGNGYCRPNDIYVPPYTKVTINGGTMYLEASPTSDEYFVAYARRDTYNISHLFFTVTVKECENLKKIPNTGISLRSPLKVQEKVDEATSYVFTGNSLRIPAIGLGMETPLPIVHVYYEEGSNDLEWDLSTLGNYVGELEGGSYLPYAGNSVLTGHYFSMGVFKNLEHLNLEDEIIIFGNDGIKYTYKVVQKFIAQPSEVYEMFQQVGERSLTLVTCENYNLVTDEYERRQIIRATIVDQEPYEVNW